MAIDRRGPSRVCLLVFVPLALASSCDGSTSPDAGTRLDASVDAATSHDGSADGAASPEGGAADGGADAGPSPDAGRADAGVDAATSPEAGVDGGTSPEAGVDGGTSPDGGSSGPWLLPGTPAHPRAYRVLSDTVVDEVTTLEWQRTIDGVLRSHEEALAYCGALVLGGHDDFRLPSRLELESIVAYGTAIDPAIDSGAFGMGPLGRTWTSSPCVFDVSGSFYLVDFFEGQTMHDLGSKSLEVRCVRGVAPPDPHRFVDRGDGTIFDPATGRVWQRNAPTQPVFNPNAVEGPTAYEYCATLTLAGGGWRVPEILELDSIFDESEGLAAPFPPSSCPSYVSRTSGYPRSAVFFYFLRADGDALYRYVPVGCVRCTR